LLVICGLDVEKFPFLQICALIAVFVWYL